MCCNKRSSKLKTNKMQRRLSENCNGCRWPIKLCVTKWNESRSDVPSPNHCRTLQHTHVATAISLHRASNYHQPTSTTFIHWVELPPSPPHYTNIHWILTHVPWDTWQQWPPSLDHRHIQRPCSKSLNHIRHSLLLLIVVGRLYYGMWVWVVRGVFLFKRIMK